MLEPLMGPLTTLRCGAPPVPPAAIGGLATATRYPNTRLAQDLRKPGYVDLSCSPTDLAALIDGTGKIRPDAVIDYAPDAGEEVDLLYALAPWGELRVAWRLPGVYHSSLFGPRQAVVAAGHLFVQDGAVTCINLDSGHFHPDEDDALRLVRRILLATRIPLHGNFLLDFTRVI